MTNHDDEVKLELAFLREQMHEVEHKITRLQDALQTSADSLEMLGLQNTLHSAELERAVLDDLLADKTGSRGVSLEALLMQHGNRYQQKMARLAGNWHQGQAISSDYWETEIRRAFFADLLRRFLPDRRQRVFLIGKRLAIGIAERDHHRLPCLDVRMHLMGQGERRPDEEEISPGFHCGSSNCKVAARISTSARPSFSGRSRLAEMS